MACGPITSGGRIYLRAAAQCRRPQTSLGMAEVNGAASKWGRDGSPLVARVRCIFALLSRENAPHRFYDDDDDDDDDELT